MKKFLLTYRLQSTIRSANSTASDFPSQKIEYIARAAALHPVLCLAHTGIEYTD